MKLLQGYPKLFPKNEVVLLGPSNGILPRVERSLSERPLQSETTGSFRLDKPALLTSPFEFFILFTSNNICYLQLLTKSQTHLNTKSSHQSIRHHAFHRAQGRLLFARRRFSLTLPLPLSISTP